MSAKQIVRDTMAYFYSNIHKIQKSKEYANIEQEPVIGTINTYMQYNKMTTLEHARLCIIEYAKDLKLVPKSLMLHANCKCIPQKKHQDRQDAMQNRHNIYVRTSDGKCDNANDRLYDNAKDRLYDNENDEDEFVSDCTNRLTNDANDTCFYKYHTAVRYATCDAISHPQDYAQNYSADQCYERLNKYNPFSYHFVNYNLNTSQTRRLYVQAVENMNKKHRIDYTSRQLLLLMCKMVCKDELTITRLELKLDWRPFENKFVRFILDYTFFFSVEFKCGICENKKDKAVVEYSKLY